MNLLAKQAGELVSMGISDNLAVPMALLNPLPARERKRGRRR